jgi:hypothetical protein
VATQETSTPQGKERGADVIFDLTSPPIEHPDVRDLQLCLRHNPFGVFDPGRDDGVYDETTAEAVRRARYWLGAPQAAIATHVDRALFDLLGGLRPLPPAWEARRAERSSRAGRVILWDAAYLIAEEELGRKERPQGSLLTPHTAWYAMRAPWPIIFVSYCYAQAGSRAFKPRECYAYAPYLMDDARRGRNMLSLTSEPLHGDIALLDTDGDGQPDTACLYDGWTDDDDHARYRAIEGYVRPEGGADRVVCRVTREASQTLGYAHVRG